MVPKFLPRARSRITGSSIGHYTWLDRGNESAERAREPLQPCSLDPLTGYFRTGCCENQGDDPGMHVVCVVMTDEFLAY